MPNVVDSSAVLAVLFDEPGAEVVLNALHDSIISSLNACEVIKVAMRRGSGKEDAKAALSRLRIPIAAFGSEDATETAALAHAYPHLGIGDCACIALARRESATEVLTADRAWAGSKFGVKITLIR